LDPTITVVVPVRNGGRLLEQCLRRLQGSRHRPLECIVVDDGSTDDSAECARRFGARVLATDGKRGPAHARNLGARVARGDVLLFVDADVCVRRDTTARVRSAFARDRELDALIGSYDDQPSAPNFASQYKNLLHCFVHQNARRSASTFWSGCGAIRRTIFLAHGGFDESYDRPAIEDIELGARLCRAGNKVVLDPELRVKHLKRWDLGTLIRSDVFDRALPWTELILREGHMPNDLNLEVKQRATVALSLLAPVLVVGALLAPSAAIAALLAAAAVCALGATIVLDAPFYRFLASRRGVLFAIAAMPLHLLYHFYSGVAFGVGVALHASRWRPGTVGEAVVVPEPASAEAELSVAASTRRR
jgi:GT2 family glycosyltransferase